MPDALLALVSNELEMFGRLRQQHPQLFPEPDQAPHLYPIPFFGDIRRAKILTLALNPSWTEFRPARQWITNLDAPALTTRLLHYFDLPVPPPHRWFNNRRQALEILDCSYDTNVAHIDLHPFPTEFRNGLGETQRTKIGDLIESKSGAHLMQVLRIASKAKLILVLDYTFSRSDGTLQQTFDFVQSERSPLAKFVVEDGRMPPIFRAEGPVEFEVRIREKAVVLRNYLHTSHTINQ
jgi:hypothetical protein